MISTMNNSLEEQAQHPHRLQGAGQVPRRRLSRSLHDNDHSQRVHRIGRLAKNSNSPPPLFNLNDKRQSPLRPKPLRSQSLDEIPSFPKRTPSDTRSPTAMSASLHLRRCNSAVKDNAIATMALSSHRRRRGRKQLSLVNVSASIPNTTTTTTATNNIMSSSLSRQTSVPSWHTRSTRSQFSRGTSASSMDYAPCLPSRSDSAGDISGCASGDASGASWRQGETTNATFDLMGGSCPSHFVAPPTELFFKSRTTMMDTSSARLGMDGTARTALDVTDTTHCAEEDDEDAVSVYDDEDDDDDCYSEDMTNPDLLAEKQEQPQVTPATYEASFAWECADCHGSNPSKFVFCTHCGIPKTVAASDQPKSKPDQDSTNTPAMKIVEPVVEPEALHDDKWRCQDCHRPNPLPFRYCSMCGSSKRHHEFDDEEEDEEDYEDDTSSTDEFDESFPPPFIQCDPAASSNAHDSLLSLISYYSD